LFFIKESPDLLKAEKDEQKLYKNIPSLISLQEDDNPVIAIIKLKDI
jgi:hypothetical protein